MVTTTTGSADQPRFCVQCGTPLNGPFCYACGAAARSPQGLPAALHPAPAPLPAARRRPALPAFSAPPPLPTLAALDPDIVMFGGAAAVVGFLMLAFPLLGLLAGFAGFVVLARRYGG